MDEQSSLSGFGEDDTQMNEYECGVCGRSFDSKLARGGHMGSHDEDKIKTELITELQSLADELGKTPTQQDIAQQGEYSCPTYQARFESWNEALKQAELEVNARQNIAKRELIDELQNLAEELGRTPGYADMNQQGKYTQRVYRDRFGSWNKALKAAGLEINVQENAERIISKPDLLNELTRLAEELGRAPTIEDMNKKGEYGQSVYQVNFDSWNEALDEAGLEPNKHHDISKSDLLNELTRLAEELGRTPGYDDMRKKGKYSTMGYETEFGSWNEALDEAGLEPNKHHDISKSDLLDELNRLADELGRTPGYVGMNQQGAYSAAVYEHMFESWNEAVMRAGFDPNGLLFPDNLSHKVRSGYEHEIAEILLNEDVDYEYEAESSVIEYGDNRVYTPDFETDEYIIEVKGYARDADKEDSAKPDEIDKAEIAMEQLTDKQYVVIQDSGPKIPADEHIQWENRDELRELL